MIQKNSLLFILSFLSLNLVAQQHPLSKYLQSQIQYPVEAANNSICGSVRVAILINEKGELVKHEIIEGKGGGCSNEVLQKVTSLQNWNDYFTGWHQNLAMQVVVKFIHEQEYKNTQIPNEWKLSTIYQTKDTTIYPENYELSEFMPEFPKGDYALLNYIYKGIKYPKKAISNATAGKVLVSFVIDTMGKPIDIKIEKGIGDGCDEEAMRIISKMPTWKPGIQNKKKVKVHFMQPITFQLDDYKIKGYDNAILIDTVKVYQPVTYNPYFVQGLDSLTTWMKSELKNSFKKIATKKQGIVEASFIIDEFGKIISPKIVKSMNEEYDTIVLNTIHQLPVLQHVNNEAKKSTLIKLIVPIE